MTLTMYKTIWRLDSGALGEPAHEVIDSQRKVPCQADDVIVTTNAALVSFHEYGSSIVPRYGENFGVMT